MSHLRALGRVVALALLGAAVIPAQIFVAGPLFKDRDTLPGFLWKSIRKIMGISVEFNGAAIRRDKPMIYMANHVSILDPFILGNISKHGGFVAMKRLADWPVFGHFAKSMGTVFASNGQSAEVLPDIHEQLTGILNAGRDITFCPEGMIKDGITVVPFRTGIISVGFNNLARQSLHQEVGYQPFALRVTHVDGKDTSLNPELRRVCIIRDQEKVLQQVWRLLRVSSIEAELTALPSMDVSDFDNARHLADTARDRIIAALTEKGMPQP